MTLIKAKDLINSPIWKIEYFLSSKITAAAKRGSVVKLAELVAIRKESFDPKKSSNEQVVYIGLENIEPIVGTIKKSKISKKNIEIKSISKKFYVGDIIFGRLRPTLNKIYYVETLDKDYGVCSNEFIVLIPNKDVVDSCFLRAILSSTEIQEMVNRYQSGSTLPRIYVEDLLSIDIPLPSLMKQRSIGKTLKSMTLKYLDIENAIQKLRNGFLDIQKII